MNINGFEIDEALIMENMMGPNAVRILEEMTRSVEIDEGMRILDLGCGKGLTSMFLAKKFGATVYATDLWISATENYERFKEQGMEDKIIPIHAEAHELPYADEFFDIIISVDSYHYFGFEDGYLDEHLAPLLKKGGRILVGVPGLKEEFTGEVPEELEPFYQHDYHFHTCQWWTELWKASKLVEGISSRELDCHQQAWDEWLRCDNEHAQEDIAMMEAEGGKYYATVFIGATRK